MVAEFVACSPEGLSGVVDALLPFLHKGVTVFLEGDLGSGKTSLVRALMDRLNCEDLVSSPSFSIINVYRTDLFPVAHFDLYRLSDDSELEVIGAEEYLDGSHLVFIEWPERCPGFLSPPDITVTITIQDDRDCRSIQIKGVVVDSCA